MNIKSIFKQKSGKNVIVGLLYQVVSILMGLILPHLFITEFGSETNGLMNSVGQVFTCLGLLEAGVGTATIQALYKPINTDDHDEINHILSATNRFYRKIGIIYTGSFIVLALVYPFFVDSEIANSTIRYVILLEGASSVIRYFVQSKYTAFLTAEGKNYILSYLLLFGVLFRNFGKIFAIKLGYGIVAVQFVQLLAVLIEASFVLIYVKSHYRWINLKTEPDYRAISAKNSVLIQSIAWMVFNHTDILLLTVFTKNLMFVSVYSVYALIFEAGQNVMNIIRDSYSYKLGAIYVKGKNEFESYFSKYSIIIISITFAVFTAIYLISVPFVRIYTASVEDINYAVRFVPELFLLFKLLYGSRALNKQIVEVSGAFKKVSHIAIIEAALNIILSVTLIWKLDIVGVLIGTVVALVYSFIAYMRYLKNENMFQIFASECKSYIICAVVTIAFFIMNLLIPVAINGWISLIICTIICSVVILIAYGIITLLRIKHRG